MRLLKPHSISCANPQRISNKNVNNAEYASHDILTNKQYLIYMIRLQFSMNDFSGSCHIHYLQLIITTACLAPISYLKTNKLICLELLKFVVKMRCSTSPMTLHLHCTKEGHKNTNQIQFYWSHTHGQQMLMRVQQNACASSSDSAVISNNFTTTT